MTVSTAPQELTKPSHFQKYYQANRERLLLLQRERRNRLRDSPEWKLQRQVYNQRHREKNDTSLYMREYYHKHKDHIATLRTKSSSTKEISDEVKEQRRLRRKELREEKKQATITSSDDPAPRPQAPRGRPKTLFTVKLTKEAIGDDATLRAALRDLLQTRFETADSVNIAISAPTEVIPSSS